VRPIEILQSNIFLGPDDSISDGGASTWIPVSDAYSSTVIADGKGSHT
jgi:hypothetical protein